MFSRAIGNNSFVFGRKLKNFTSTPEPRVEDREMLLILNPYSYHVGGPVPQPLLVDIDFPAKFGFGAGTAPQIAVTQHEGYNAHSESVRIDECEPAFPY